MDNFFYSPDLFDNIYMTAIRRCVTVEENHMEMLGGFDSKTTKFYLCGSFSNAVSSSDYIASNDQMISE
jgi:hypothetical protein